MEIYIHLMAVLPALILGGINISLKKGTKIHRIVGIVWAGFMMIVAVSSLFIKPTGHYTWLHLFSILVIVVIPLGVYFIRQGHSKPHFLCMVGAYIGTVLSAYFAVVTPHRFLHGILF